MFLFDGLCGVQDSNQFHAVCLDTYPPIFYLNDVSRRVIHMVSTLNSAAPAIKVTRFFTLIESHVLFTLSVGIVPFQSWMHAVRQWESLHPLLTQPES